LNTQGPVSIQLIEVFSNQKQLIKEVLSTSFYSTTVNQFETVVFFLKVLIQGCLVTEQNVNTVLELVHNQLMELEDFLAKTTSTLYCDASDKVIIQIDSI